MDPYKALVEAMIQVVTIEDSGTWEEKRNAVINAFTNVDEETVLEEFVAWFEGEVEGE